MIVLRISMLDENEEVGSMTWDAVALVDQASRGIPFDHQIAVLSEGKFRVEVVEDRR